MMMSVCMWIVSTPCPFTGTSSMRVALAEVSNFPSFAIQSTYPVRLRTLVLFPKVTCSIHWFYLVFPHVTAFRSRTLMHFLLKDIPIYSSYISIPSQSTIQSFCSLFPLPKIFMLSWTFPGHLPFFIHLLYDSLPVASFLTFVCDIPRPCLGILGKVGTLIIVFMQKSLQVRENSAAS